MHKNNHHLRYYSQYQLLIQHISNDTIVYNWYIQSYLILMGHNIFLNNIIIGIYVGLTIDIVNNIGDGDYFVQYVLIKHFVNEKKLFHSINFLLLINFLHFIVLHDMYLF